MVNTIHCAYCEKELDRLVFCNASHKVMFHRKIYKPSTSTTKPIIKTDKIIKTKEDVIKAIKPSKGSTVPCRHGLLYCSTCK